MPPAVLVPPSGLLEFNRKQKALEAIWAEANVNKPRLRKDLADPISLQGVGTDIFSALDYASYRLRSFDGDRRLIICSDLAQDSEGVKTTFPPRQRYPFPRVVVEALFVPWHGSVQTVAQMQAWCEWFTAAGAADFKMYDEVQSTTIRALAPSSVPVRLSSPFAKRAKN